MREPENPLYAVESGGSARDYVDFWPAGAVAKGYFRCTACGASTNVKFVLPRCEECGERLWEREESSPYAGVS
jgi:hypothetical protein